MLGNVDVGPPGVLEARRVAVKVKVALGRLVKVAEGSWVGVAGSGVAVPIGEAGE